MKVDLTNSDQESPCFPATAPCEKQTIYSFINQCLQNQFCEAVPGPSQKQLLELFPVCQPNRFVALKVNLFYGGRFVDPQNVSLETTSKTQPVKQTAEPEPSVRAKTAPPPPPPLSQPHPLPVKAPLPEKKVEGPPPEPSQVIVTKVPNSSPVRPELEAVVRQNSAKIVVKPQPNPPPHRALTPLPIPPYKPIRDPLDSLVDKPSPILVEPRLEIKESRPADSFKRVAEQGPLNVTLARRVEYPSPFPEEDSKKMNIKIQKKPEEQTRPRPPPIPQTEPTKPVVQPKPSASGFATSARSDVRRWLRRTKKYRAEDILRRRVMNSIVKVSDYLVGHHSQGLPTRQTVAEDKKRLSDAASFWGNFSNTDVFSGEGVEPLAPGTDEILHTRLPARVCSPHFIFKKVLRTPFLRNKLLSFEEIDLSRKQAKCAKACGPLVGPLDALPS